jgi:hypothetical protein
MPLNKHLIHFLHHNYHKQLQELDDDLLRKVLHLLQNTGAVSHTDLHDSHSLHDRVRGICTSNYASKRSCYEDCVPHM